MSQKTVAQLTTEINTQIATNGTNAITAAVMRPVLQDMVDSAGNLADGTPATIYSANGTLAGNRTVSGGGNSLIINALSEFEAACTNGVDAAFTDIGSDYVDIKVSGVGATAEIFMQKDSLQVSIPGNGAQYGITGQKVGFMGATPVVRVASANQAVATDPTSTQTLANALRQALIDLGLIKGSA